MVNMKKYSFIIIFVLVLLITGCDKDKRIICRHSQTDSFYGDSSVNYKLVYDEDGNLKTLKINSESKYNKEYLEVSGINIDDEFKSASTMCDTYNETENVKCDAKLQKNNKIVLNIEFDISKMDDEEIAVLNLADYKNSSMSDAKETFKKMGLTCK